MSIEKNKTIVRRFHSELWAGNLQVVDELLHPNFSGGMGRGEEIKEAVAGWRSVVPDVQLHIEDLIAEGDKVVMRWRTTGTNTGPNKAPDGSPLPPTGKLFSYTGITINQIADDKIISDVFENSWLAMVNQMQTE